ncbi:gonadotropin-releasing hormone receptor-like [Limulus polyphemus]|uniref:Gonadotropin-releasing hormone receptor-like n=1 Tax=Limulus polyphemus TaxID=6850 RepID=A0ABM1BR74_LIMPO|nr:gonadotropin-releasing hormone receptor-like [Limulus polyphemus]
MAELTETWNLDDSYLNLTSFDDFESNKTNETKTLPDYLTFNADSVREIVVYSILFVVAATGNLPVFISLLRNRQRKSPVKLMMLNLAVADLIVTFVMIPLEISWRVTVEWIAGTIGCKIMLFLRAFGPYLSSMVLVCISFDRYFAIVHPLKLNDAKQRSKIMLICAWVISVICAVPQVGSLL